MVRFLAILLGMMIGLSAVAAPAPEAAQSYYTVTDLGCPTQHCYQDTTPRTPWDMIVYGNKLYIGAGDYDRNTGNTPIYAYDLAKKTWTETGTVANESVARFVLIRRDLYAPGIDPTTSSWAYGNYYRLTETGWVCTDNLPNGVHHFDLAQHQGELFYGIGTANTETSPVQKSVDGGNTYVPVDFLKDGVSFLGDPQYAFYRVYDFFQVGGALYCIFVATNHQQERFMGFFKYNGTAFDHIAQPEALRLQRYGLSQLYLGGKATVGDTCYFTTGVLYRTKDFTECTVMPLPDGGIATDLVKDGSFIYVLSYTALDDGTYQNKIWRLNPRQGTFTYVTGVETDGGYALSLAKTGNQFFLGLSHGSQSGTILHLQPGNPLLTYWWSLPLDTVDPTRYEAAS